MENILLSYQNLLKVTGRSIQQLRRCALVLFGVDSDAARQGGKAREFSLTEGFAIYLAAVLVGDYGLKLSDAKQRVLEILWNVGRDGPEADLTDLGFLRPPIGWKLDSPVRGVLLRIYAGPRPRLVYEFRVFKEAPVVVEDWVKYTQERVETYTSYWLPQAAMADEGFGATPGMIYEIPLTGHLWHFFRSLRALGF